MKIAKIQNNQNDYSIIQNLDWYEKQKVAGKVVANALKMCSELATIKNCLDISKTIEEYILDSKCTPTFKNYNGFPESICISINKELVHGIPKDFPLKEGDVVSFDIGATYYDSIADAATTIIVGENKKALHLVNTTKIALDEAIKNIKIDERLGIIGETIYKIGSKNNLQVITKYGGHFIAKNEPHSKPFISNKDKKENGIRFQNGMSFAIEPLFCLGLFNDTYIGEDKWTVYTKDISAHFEHTVFIINGKAEVMTNV